MNNHATHPPAGLTLTRYERDLLWHTEHRAADGLFCGSAEDIEDLIARGIMEYAGRKPGVPDPFFRLTSLGRDALRNAKFKPTPTPTPTLKCKPAKKPCQPHRQPSRN